MVETPDDPSLLERLQNKAYVSKSRLLGVVRHPILHLSSPSLLHDAVHPEASSAGPSDGTISNPGSTNLADNSAPMLFPSAPPPTSEDRHGATSASIEPEPQPNSFVRFYITFKEILLSSYINILLVFVPVGIAVNFAGISPTVVFAINAIAIVPLAGLLSHATESVAHSMGDTVGALMNVTFGNAVELIIFMYVKLEEIKTYRKLQAAYKHLQLDSVPCYLSFVVPLVIALVKNEIRIVQASLLGSILANLMLILGMCFLFGGLRFREQIYNSTVTQMSACLLSLSVMSLLLPTAFHASFTDNNVADIAVLQVSRGSSIILLLVYVLYLLFQLKSHAYMYESTPQHVIDEESHPGLLADMLGSSSSSDTTDSSNASDSDDSSDSHTTAKRIRRAFRGRRRRKSSASSKETPSMPSAIRTPSVGTFNDSVLMRSPTESITPTPLRAIASGDEADTDGEHDGRGPRIQLSIPLRRDFETEKSLSGLKSPGSRFKKKYSRKHHKKQDRDGNQPNISEKKDPQPREKQASTPNSQRVSFVQEVQIMPENAAKRPFNIRGISVHPAIPKMLTSTVFSAANPSGLPGAAPMQIVVPPAPYGLRRANSLPDRLNNTDSAPMSRLQQQLQTNGSSAPLPSEDIRKSKKYISRTSAIILLVVSTGLVAVCAEFLVSSITYLVDNTSISEEFIGLIILPIVGNAAEHVTAVTVASKNKMDLAIGVAVGSSIQIALFVTPVIVLLGWILAKDMSLYFSLFETIALFVSAFIVNFLVLDGRSNYLEGALLIAAYIIIAVSAFFYPDSSQQSTIGGASSGMRMF